MGFGIHFRASAIDKLLLAAFQKDTMLFYALHQEIEIVGSLDVILHKVNLRINADGFLRSILLDKIDDGSSNKSNRTRSVLVE